MNLDKILEYQKIDFAIYKEEVALAKSDVAKKVQDYRVKLTQVQNELIKMDKETADAFREIERIEEQLAAYISEKKTDLSYDNLTVLKQVDNLESTLLAYQEQIIGLEKDGQRALRKLKDITTKANQRYADGNKIKAEFLKVHAAYAAKQKELKAKFESEHTTLTELRKDIGEDFLKRYTALRNQRKMPAFAVVSADAKNCEICGMEWSNAVVDRINNGGHLAECPHCRRILFEK